MPEVCERTVAQSQKKNAMSSYNREPMVRVKWGGNDSSRYDGKTQDIERRFILSEYLDGMAVGSTIKLRWGKQSRIWTAVVVDLLPLGCADELAEPKGKRKRVRPHPNPETASNKRGKYM